MTRISTIGNAQGDLQAEFNKLIDYQNMIYQRLLLLAKIRQRVKAQYPQAVLPFDHVFRSYVNSYNTRVEAIKANAKDVQVGVQKPFEHLADEFKISNSIAAGPAVIAAIVVCVIAALAGTAYTITEVKRQNVASETEIVNLDKLLATFKAMPGANANTLASLLAKIDYVPGGTTPPDTGLTSTIKSLMWVGVGIAVLTQIPKFIGK